MSRPAGAGSLELPRAVGSTKEDWIGNQLKRIYNEALEEDIPDDMMALLNQLDAEPADEERVQ
ncbi:RNA polymerase sigma factor [Polymorphum gilvum SL003B-26A1]|uniref:RNA polymerase sigma factor n=1 Tax=Polymorphum gilvum (strain LMG 25793 / CGMCC 1.9160 / SL003B-26A1) TaxID=991905 RepID=F2IYP1_POLGS|nr:RNA polymerase sigma factor [Polymorphum gilvum SL003B-26A1]